MAWMVKIFTSSVGKKFIMGLTGLFLCTFLVVHLTGNFLLFKGDGGEAFNHYSKFMSTNPMIRIMEVGLVLGFLFHIVNGLFLAKTNQDARPVGYAVSSGSKNSGWTSRHMPFTGGLILVFLLLHLYSFTMKHRILEAHEPMFETVKRAFEDPYYSLFYMFAFVLLGLHLYHGFKSAFQSLGINHKKYNPIIQFVGLAFCILIPLGYISIPTYFLIKKQQKTIQQNAIQQHITDGKSKTIEKH